MEIKYLKHLKSNPVKPGSTRYWIIEPLSITEIQNLEQIYNNSQEFPKALRELLWLAGEYCYVLDYGLYDNLHQMQQAVRNYMSRQNRTIARPFFAIDVYNNGEQFLFVYLDDVDDPAVYEGLYYGSGEYPDWIHKVSDTLSSYINDLVDRVQQGRSAF